MIHRAEAAYEKTSADRLNLLIVHGRLIILQEPFGVERKEDVARISVEGENGGGKIPKIHGL